MQNPFHSLPACVESDSTTNGKNNRNRRYHVNNPLFHKFPTFRRMQERFLWKFYARSSFLDHIPRSIHILFVSLYLLIMALLFAYFFGFGYFASVNESFLSPLNNQMASKNCELIPAVNTGQYYATMDGYWQG
jgi:hypothetical protein